MTSWAHYTSWPAASAKPCNKWKADAAKVVEYSKESWKADTGDHVLFNAKTYHNTEQT